MTMHRRLLVIYLVLMTGVAAAAQSFPRFEVAAGYSFMHFHPEVPQLETANLNGGGAAIVYNPLSWLGIKAEFTGYAFGSDWSSRLRELGYTGPVQRGMFLYQFGPQIKKHSGRWQPYAHSLYGLAHSAGYSAVLRAKGSGTYILTNSGSNENAFAMEVGGGLDIRLTPHVQLRPVELDYQMTRFGFQTFSSNQNNFKYFGGVNFTFGER
jgi:opacity protein-like surface antigen